MKARVPIPRDIRRRMDEYNRNESRNMTRRMFKVLAVSLNRMYGFGGRRILRVIDDMTMLLREHENDPVFWTHLDRRVIDELGVPLDRENYDLMEAQP